MVILLYLCCFAGRLCAKHHNGSQRGHDALLSHLHFNTGHKPTQVLGQGLATKSILYITLWGNLNKPNRRGRISRSLGESESRPLLWWRAESSRPPPRSGTRWRHKLPGPPSAGCSSAPDTLRGRTGTAGGQAESGVRLSHREVLTHTNRWTSTHVRRVAVEQTVSHREQLLLQVVSEGRDSGELIVSWPRLHRLSVSSSDLWRQPVEDKLLVQTLNCIQVVSDTRWCWLLRKRALNRAVVTDQSHGEQIMTRDEEVCFCLPCCSIRTQQKLQPSSSVL